MLDAAEHCWICALLLKAFGDHVKQDDGAIDFFRTESNFRAGSGGLRLARFCAPPGQYKFPYTAGGVMTEDTLADSNQQKIRHVPIGLPALHTAEPTAQFELLRQWLGWCDAHHKCNKQSQCEYVLKQAKRHSGRHRTYLWCDGICIMQAKEDDSFERNHQVSMLGEIYWRAERVLACVGDHSNDNAYLFRIMPDHSTFLKAIGYFELT